MKVVLELDEEAIKAGYVTVTKVTEKGWRKGQLPVNELVEFLGAVYGWDVVGRRVKMISRFAMGPFLAFGQNGPRWQALKVVEPAQYYLVSDTGQVYLVSLPRLVVLVGNYTVPHIWWTEDRRVRPRSRLYPLMIGNVDRNGAVCLGNTGLRCEQPDPDEIDRFVRRVIEAPSSGHQLDVPADRLYEGLARGWDSEIGRKHGVRLKQILECLQ